MWWSQACSDCSWSGSLRWWEFQGFIVIQLSSKSWIKFLCEVLFKILSEAYLLVNLCKQVPLRAVLVSVLYFKFVQLVVHELEFLSCILIAVLESENLKHFVTFCLSPFAILPFMFTCWSYRLAAGREFSCRLRFRMDKMAAIHVKIKNHRAWVENWGFFGERA